MNIDLNLVWYILVGLLLTGYALLDGFDLGVGALHLLTRKDKHRRIFLNSIGPVWDGNEVWLITGGGALFAAFPEVYATAFSGLYIAFMLLLFSLIFRAVSIEFRSKLEMQWWRKLWDIGFSAGSFMAALLIGIALGNIARGLPLDENHEFAGAFFGLLNPYALLVGLMTISLLVMHGSLYLTMKTEDELLQQVKGWVKKTIIIFISFYVITTAVTLIYLPHMSALMRNNPVLVILPLLTIIAIANIPREIHRGREFRAFLSSCATIILLMTLLGLGIFPNLILSNPDPVNSLTITNAASSPKTLKIMLIIAIIGMPLVIAYTSIIYWIFRGKVKLTSTSY